MLLNIKVIPEMSPQNPLIRIGMVIIKGEEELKLERKAIIVDGIS